MKVLLEIPDHKVDFFMELLSNFPFIKTRKLTPYKSEIIEGLKDSIDQVKLHKEGKIQLGSAKDLLDEL